MEDAKDPVEGTVGASVAQAQAQGSDSTPAYECSSLAEIQQQLRQLLDANSGSAIPALVTGNFSLSSTANFRIARPVSDQDSPAVQKTPRRDSDEPSATPTTDGGRSRRSTNFVNEDVCAAQVLKDIDSITERTKYQRGIAKVIVAAIGEVDGFRYGVRNEWESKKDGHRFQYACQDSLQNKDRKRNKLRVKKAVDDPETPDTGSSSMLPTYDCGGLVTIKFSTANAKIDVIYGHAAIHRTVASRRGPTRQAPEQSPTKTGPDVATSTMPHTPNGHASAPVPIPAPAANPYYLPEHLATGPQVALVQRPLEFHPQTHPVSLVETSAVDDVPPQFIDPLLRQQVLAHPPIDPLLTQATMTLESAPLNPFFTTNGTPKQEGVFDPTQITPDGPKPAKKAKIEKDKPNSTEKRKRATGIVRSRNGCTTCRQRRIKCDEGHPVCMNCSKSHRECSYTSPVVTSAISSRSASHSRPSAGPEGIVSNPGPGDGHNWQPMGLPMTDDLQQFPGPFPQQDVPPALNVDVDERLMHLLTQPAMPRGI